MNDFFELLRIEKLKQKGGLQMSLLILPAVLSTLWIMRGLGKHDDLWGLFLFHGPIMNAIFLPVFIALFASRIMDIEHRANTWKLLYTFTRPGSLFFAKVLYGSVRIAVVLILQCFSIAIIGLKRSPAVPIPYTNLLWMLLTGFIVTEILFLLHAVISFFVRSQAIGIITGIAGSFLGLFLSFLPSSILQRIFPWGLYECTLAVLMDWNKDTGDLKFVRIPFPVNDLVVCFAWLMGMIAIAGILLRRGNTDERGITRKNCSSEIIRSKAKHLRLPTELVKMRQPAVWLALFVLPVISAAIGTANYLGNRDILTHGWYDLWSQLTLFLNYFFQPALIGVFASCIWRTEHTGTNWNQLLVNALPARIVIEKLLATLFFSSLSVIWTAILFVICGNIAGIEGSLPGSFSEWIICGIIGSGCVVGIQLVISLLIRNFVIPIGLAFAGSIANLGVTAKFGQPYILPYSLLAVGMRSNNPFYILDYTAFAISAGVQLMLWPMLAVLYIKYSDVKTND